ncbi:phosphoenolpyruvate--protein phosphotransferase [Tessaracoccus flavus]|nr:phosphoenolpyruvate--protein phosphotransferase [Tessaracoccus flavus]SDZ16561.1 phosphotransferase system, enzyme I, PtsI [Tessaracoccus flavus]
MTNSVEMPGAHVVAPLTGVGVSGGSAVGVVAVVSLPEPLPDEAASADPAGDLARVGDALETVAAKLDATAASLSGDAAEMLGAAAAIARDPGLLDAVEENLRSQGPAHALHAAVEGYAAQFEELGGYFAERVTDLLDVGRRAEAVLLDRPMPGVPELTEPSVVIAHDLAPADTAMMDPALVVGIVTEAGGRTSHTAILASQRGIPAIVQAQGALSLTDGTRVGIDGDSGELVVDPDDAWLAVRAEKARARERVATLTGPGQTSDGHPVMLLANIGNVADAELAGATDVEGVGLFRTEFLHLSASTAPTVEQQAAEYVRILAPFGERPVTVRTLDAGADKPLAFADLGPEPNPALGRRGLRLMREREDLLDDQLAALALAAAETGADVKVMAPMVATTSEAAWFTRRAHDAGLPTAGVMMEVPSSALRAQHILKVTDFASLGTNDLAQYTMAADRMVGELSDLLDPWQPAVLDMVAVACEGGRVAGKPVGVCGESAGDPLMALVLAGLGVASLSMAPQRVPMVRYALSLHTAADCRRMAEAARAADSPDEAREAAHALASGELTELL